MIETPYQPVSFQGTVDQLLEARAKLKSLTKQAWLHFLNSQREKCADKHAQMNALVEEAFALARQTIDSLPEDILKIAGEQSSKMGTFYHTRGGMPSREYEIYMYLMGAEYDFKTRKGFVERNIVRARKELEPYMGTEAITWEQYKAFTDPHYMDWPDPLQMINYIGDEFYVLTLILNKVPEHLRQSHEMMMCKFKAGNKKANRH